MRPLLIASLFVVLGFAGCIDSDLLNPDDETGSSQDTFQADPSLQEMPERSFEPELILDAPELIELQVEQGTQVNFTFNITDLHDYPFPLTFVDWNLTYNREPNPVAEGDAHDLPAEWNRTLFAEDHHAFRFNVDDGQGFKANTTIIIKVGDPPPLEGPVDTVADDSGGSAVYEPMAIEKSILVTASCKATCTALFANAPYGREFKAVDCSGLQINRNGIGCAWVELPPSAVGATFSVTSESAAGENDPDVVFLDRCAPWAMSIQRFGSAGGESGVVPAGARCMMAYHWGDDHGDIHFKVDEFQNAISGHIPYDTEVQTEFFTGPSTPCMEDVQGLRASGVGYGCPGLMAGPYSMWRDGWWIPIDPRYEGATLAVDDAAESGTTDTDCLFLDHMLNVVGSAHGGLGPCAGTVPEGAYWLYQYSYIGPAVENKVTFTLDSAVASAAEEQGMPVGETLMEDYEDLGGVWKHKETNVCYVKSYTGTNGINGIPGFHYISYGTWFWQETNGIPGLQVSPDDAGAQNVGSPAPDGCTGGDLTVL